MTLLPVQLQERGYIVEYLFKNNTLNYMYFKNIFYENNEIIYIYIYISMACRVGYMIFLQIVYCLKITFSQIFFTYLNTKV